MNKKKLAFLEYPQVLILPVCPLLIIILLKNYQQQIKNKKTKTMKCPRASSTSRRTRMLLITKKESTSLVLCSRS